MRLPKFIRWVFPSLIISDKNPSEREDVMFDPVPITFIPRNKKMISTKELIRVYGPPNENGSYLVRLKLPYPMRLAWDTNVVVKTITCHEKVADELLAIFQDILKEYGLRRIKELGIDLYGGVFNYRKMRGGSDWSRHSWGVAIDLDPSRNKLRETDRTARFAREEYKPMIKIFYEHGWESLGIEKNYDWMHFQVQAGQNK